MKGGYVRAEMIIHRSGEDDGDKVIRLQSVKERGKHRTVNVS